MAETRSISPEITKFHTGDPFGYIQPRLELRDEFAMAALTGMLSNESFSVGSSQSMAVRAYNCADAMLEVRKL